MGKRNINFDVWWPDRPLIPRSFWRYLVPHPGTFIMTLLVIGGLLWAQSVGALPLGRPQVAPNAASTGAIAYQGRLADSAGAPLTGTYNMIFRLYDLGAGGTPLWEEQWTGSNGVKVSDGLFNVMLGSLTPIPQSAVTGHDQLFLGITVGTDDEMAPRVQLGSVPYATQALTIPDGSVSTDKIADGAVTSVKLAPGVIDNATVEQSKVVSNVQFAQGDTEVSVAAKAYVDLLSLTVAASESATLRISYHALVWKTDNWGRSAIMIRINGDPNTQVENNSWVYVGQAVSPGWAWDSDSLSRTWFTNVPAGTHTVTLVLGSWDSGVSHSRPYGLNVEVLRQP